MTNIFSPHNCIFIILLFSPLRVLANNDATLKQLHVLFRHGERSPTETYPNDPYKDFNWSGGWGQLTNTGKLQMYELGKKLRTQYKHFIPEFYWPEEVNVTSSYADRCMMSAELLLAGIFPPKGPQIWNLDLLWQPIPIHYLPRSQDNMIAMKATCNKYDEEFKAILMSSKVQNILSSNRKLMEYLTENTGMPVDSIGVVETLFNTLQIEQLHNLSLPIWVNDSLMMTMEKLGAQNLALYSETEYMLRMKGGVFLNYVITSMGKSLQERKTPTLHLYSGHDLTLVHILRALNLVDTIKPDFGATLIFELYSDGEVKINYRNSWNGIVEEQQINFCISPCLLSRWKQVLDSVLPSDWIKECNK